jgi:hypothetical protein
MLLSATVTTDPGAGVEPIVAERPILFSGSMVCAILEGRKTQTRLVVTPQPDAVYGLTADRLTVYRKNDENQRWCFTEADPRVPECGLYGRGGWTSLLTHEIRGLWSEGFRGVVSAVRSPKQEGIFDCLLVPRKREGDENGPQSNMYGLSRDATVAEPSSKAQGWESGKLQATESCVGDASRELDGSKDTREAVGKSDIQIYPGGAPALALGNFQGSLQPANSGNGSRCKSVLNIRTLPWQVNARLWVRENMIRPDGDPWLYAADKQPVMVSREDETAMLVWAHHKEQDHCPSIHMRRWASRITLKVTEVRVERVQAISEEDARAEGCDYDDMPEPPPGFREEDRPTASREFQCLWDSINAKKYPWSLNPWVWCVSFRRVAS